MGLPVAWLIGSGIPVCIVFGYSIFRYFGISVSAGSGIAVAILTRLSVVVMDVVTLRRVRSVPFDAGLYRFWFFNISVFRFCGYAYPAWFRSLPSSSSSSSLLRSPATVCRSWSISSSFWAICALMPAGSRRGGIRAPASRRRRACASAPRVGSIGRPRRRPHGRARPWSRAACRPGS